jgi:hypothetical protein
MQNNEDYSLQNVVIVTQPAEAHLHLSKLIRSIYKFLATLLQVSLPYESQFKIAL